MEALKNFVASGCLGFPLESPSKALSGVDKAYTTNMCLGLDSQPGHRFEQCHFTQGCFSHTFPGNDAKMLAPCNFPMVVVGSHRGNHFKLDLDCLLAKAVREGSLLSW